MTTEIQELPEVGEIVVATVTRIMDQGAYVSLDEYNNIQGFLHISEIATGWIRHVEKFVKVGEKKVLLVKRVNTARSEIDLSLKQVSSDQKKKKLLELKRNEKEQILIDSLRTKAGLTQAEAEKLEGVLVNKFNSIYDAFSEIVSKGITVLDDLNLPKKTLSTIEEISSKIQVPHVEIRGVLELTSTKSNGIEIIKKSLLEAMESKDASVEITYIGAPKYRLTVSAQNFKTAEKALKPVLLTIQTTIEKKGGTYKFTREESKKTREG
ncbi:MAG TPA: translation initiation factor IF-2 subunit alpha [Nitrosopumilaceae archaeon]|nr:translation initiation factor IF-2 subunit alpha [Nitrosopumilaceae archaeon]